MPRPPHIVSHYFKNLFFIRVHPRVSVVFLARGCWFRDSSLSLRDCRCENKPVIRISSASEIQAICDAINNAKHTRHSALQGQYKKAKIQMLVKEKYDFNLLICYSETECVVTIVCPYGRIRQMRILRFGNNRKTFGKVRQYSNKIRRHINSKQSSQLALAQYWANAASERDREM